MSSSGLIRQAQEADLVAMADITSRSYHAVNERAYERSWPAPVLRGPERRAGWIERAGHVMSTDPDGCWVAVVDGRVVGLALSRIREKMWILSSFAVEIELQGHGIGRALLAATQHYGRGCLRGLFAASADPGAVRRYRLAGFDLHPQMFLRGVVDRGAIPIDDHLRQGLRDGSASDVDLLDSIDRRTRGAAHLDDHALLMRQFRLVVLETSSSQGYAYVDASGSAQLVAATSRRTAAALLWEALASSEPGSSLDVRHITAANQWALDVGLAARMSIHTSGYLCTKGMKPPTAYLHHGSLL